MSECYLASIIMIRKETFSLYDYLKLYNVCKIMRTRIETINPIFWNGYVLTEIIPIYELLSSNLPNEIKNRIKLEPEIDNRIDRNISGFIIAEYLMSMNIKNHRRKKYDEIRNRIDDSKMGKPFMGHSIKIAKNITISNEKSMILWTNHEKVMQYAISHCDFYNILIKCCRKKDNFMSFMDIDIIQGEYHNRINTHDAFHKIMKFFGMNIVFGVLPKLSRNDNHIETYQCFISKTNFDNEYIEENYRQMLV